MSKNQLHTKSRDFAIRIVRLYQFLTKTHSEYVMSKQVLRSGTSIGANVAEAMSGQSRADFIAKLSISLKEASETHYWLDILYETGYLTQTEYKSIDNDCRELIALLTSILKTCRSSLK